MNKRLIIFTAVSLLWCFALGLFLCKQNEAILPLQNTDFSADVLLAQKKPTPVTILNFGDMMLDRNVRAQINKNGAEYPFAQIKDFLQGNDIVVVNAEGPFTYNKSITIGVKNGPLSFTFDPAILSTLKNLGFTLLGLANNHTLNFGVAGFKQSTTSIENAGLNWFGDPLNKKVYPYITEIRGEKIAFIGYHEFAYQGGDKILQAIKDAKAESDFVLVYPHWGEEYKMDFTQNQQEVAHAFIDAGADVVIGTHPHVVEPIEVYKNKAIFYSLGNFIFDQAQTGPTSRGLVVKVSLAHDYATYDLFPISIIKQQASLAGAEDRQAELDRIEVPSGTIILPR